MRKVGVTSKAFSNNRQLVSLLASKFPDYKLNLTGKAFSEDELIDFLADCDGCIVALEAITTRVLKESPNLKFISKYGVGLDNIDIPACNDANVKVGWKAGVNKSAVAEMTLAFALMLLRNLYVTSNYLRQGTWVKNGGVSLFGKTVGIVGLGNIGAELVRILQPFNCRVIACDIEDKSSVAKRLGIELVSFDELVCTADVVTLHVPKSPATHGLIDREVLNKMKSSAIVINTSRGGVINETDLINAIEQHQIAGAALDVYESEPLEKEALYSLEQVICTPHIGGNSIEAVIAMGESALEQLDSLYNGSPGITA